MKSVVRRFDMSPYFCSCGQHRGDKTPACVIEVEVDMARLARQMHGTALHNRTRRSVEAGGAVVVRIVNEVAEASNA